MAKDNRVHFFISASDPTLIPNVDDVMNVLVRTLGWPLRFENRTVHISRRGPAYMGNIIMVVAIARDQVECELSQGEIVTSRQIVAGAIAKLYPQEKACLLDQDYAELVSLAGQALPPTKATRELLCRCQTHFKPKARAAARTN